jgi:hypothetical protein
MQKGKGELLLLKQGNALGTYGAGKKTGICCHRDQQVEIKSLNGKK